jgi:hypothetical protein
MAATKSVSVVSGGIGGYRGHHGDWTYIRVVTLERKGTRIGCVSDTRLQRISAKKMVYCLRL